MSRNNQTEDSIALPVTKTGKIVNCQKNRTMSVVVEYLHIPERMQHFNEECRLYMFTHFMDSLGEYAGTIDGIDGYTEHTLIQQAAYFRTKSRDDVYRKNSIQLVVDFYRYLVRTNVDKGYFDGASLITNRLLTNKNLSRYLEMGWDFIAYSPTAKYNGQNEFLLVLHGFDKHSSRMTHDDYKPIHMKCIDEPFFRQLYFDYMISSHIHFGECEAIHIGCIGDIINKICSIKKSQMSTNTDLSHFTVQEGRLIRRIIDSAKAKVSTRFTKCGDNITLGTKNNRLGFMRRWFQWAESRGRLTFDRTFFDEFTQFEEPVKRNAKPVPDAELSALFILAKKKSEEGYLNKLFYLAMTMILQTHFRPSDVLSLKASNISLSESQHVYTIRHKTKTSGPNMQIDPLTRYDYDILQEAIKQTESLRECTSDDKLKDRIFIYKECHGLVRAVVREDLYAYMGRLCTELGFANIYGPYNLRYSYMTKVFQNAVANDLSEVELRVLTKHVKLGTTAGYVKKNRSDYFKALYNVMLEDVQLDIAPKIVETMPDSAQELGADSGGCGRCKALNCIYNTILPCITCEHFVTTVAYEPFFKRMIEMIDQQLERAKYPHDKEDLVTMKEIYVSFLVEFDRIKQTKI